MWFEGNRRTARAIRVGSLTLGGGAPVSVQSMLNTDSRDAAACVAQAERLCREGCELIRMAVPVKEAAATLAALKEAGIRVPLVADIHFDYRIALEAVACGADKIRINPGNIGCVRLWRLAVLTGFRYESASTPVLCKRISWRSTAGRRRRRWLKAL